MRIVAKPYVVPGCSGCPRGITIIECSNGKAYEGPELAKICGMRWPTLRERLRRQNWRRKDILAKDLVHWMQKLQNKTR